MGVAAAAGVGAGRERESGGEGAKRMTRLRSALLESSRRRLMRPISVRKAERTQSSSRPA